MLQTLTGDGSVAVYRWFENGEGWAYHPWYGSRGLELSRAVDRILKGRPAGTFCVPALGGFLVGEHCDDPLCPDPKARERRPTILRAAYLSFEPSERDTERVLGALRKLPLAAERCEDNALTLDRDLCRELTQRYAHAVVSPSDGNGDGEAGGARRGSRLWRLLSPLSRGDQKALNLVSLLAGVVLLSWGAIYLARHLGSREGPPSEPEKGESRPASRPEPASRVSEDNRFDPEMLTSGRFRDALGAHAAIDHPYTAYLKFHAERLPATAGKWNQEGALVDALAAVNYEQWRAKAGARDYVDRDKPLPERLRRFVEHFRTPTPGLQRAAVQMAELLQGWGEGEPSAVFAQHHPFAVIDRFFAFLTRPSFAPRPLQFDHPKTGFLWRLPADPVAEGCTYETEEELARSLRQLLQHLERDFNPFNNTDTVPVLLQRVTASMRYRDWLRREGARAYADGKNDAGTEVNRFVGRFER